MSKPKAVLCTELGPPSKLQIQEIDAPTPGPSDVIVQVHAAGVNFPDTLIIRGKYQFKPSLPFSPGAEAAGIVTAVGSKVKGFKAGDRVVAMATHGGFAEELKVPASRLVRLPPGMPLDVGAAITMTYGTSFHALYHRARVQPGETVLVLGAAGGVGLAAVELAVAMGAVVIAAASSEEKLETCRRFGAAHTINYTKENLKNRVKEITKGAGVNVVYDPVGGPYSEPALRSIGWEGRYLVVGFAAGDIPKVPLNLALLKGCQIVGVFYGAFTGIDPAGNAMLMRVLWQWYGEGRIKPLVSERFPLEQAADALVAIENRKVQGKAVLVTRHFKASSKL